MTAEFPPDNATVARDFHKLGVMSVGISSHQSIAGALHIALTRGDGSQLVVVVSGAQAESFRASLAAAFEKMPNAATVTH